MTNDTEKTPVQWLKTCQGITVSSAQAKDPAKAVLGNCNLLNGLDTTHDFAAKPGGFIKLLQDLSLKQIRKPDVDDA